MSWSVKSIDDITEVVTKGTTPSTYGMPFTDEGINFVKAEALNGDVTLDRSGFTFINDETHEKLQRSKLQQDDVLVTIAGANVGKCGYVRPSDVPANTNQAVGIVRVKKEEANPRYIYYHFKNPSTFAMCQGIGGGQAAQPNINLTMLKGFKVNMPDLESQNRIVGVIGAYDDLVENNKRRIELLEESARQLYKEWFVRFRFPGHEHVKIIDGVPEGWISEELSELCQLRAGGSFKLEYQGRDEGEIPFIKVRDMNSSGNSIYITEADNWVTEDECSSFRGKTFAAGASVFAKIGEALKKNRVRLISQNTLIDNNMMGAIPKKDKINSFYLYMKLKSFDFGSMSGGAAVPFLSAKALGKEKVIVPSKLLLDEFGEIAEAIYSQIENLQRQIVYLQKARDLLLPKLMSGEIVV